MSYKRLMIHTCTIVTQGVEVGRDAYNQPIFGESETQNVKCRMDRITKRRSVDDGGVEYIEKHMLYLLKNAPIDDTSKIKSFQDIDGNDIFPGIWRVDLLIPQYAGKRFHHYECEMQKESENDAD